MTWTVNDRVTIEEEAATWLMRQSEPDWCDARDAEFHAWLNMSFTHAAAFWRLKHGYAQLDVLSRQRPATQNFRREVVVSPRRLATAAVLAVLMISSLTLLHSGQPIATPIPTTYSTAPGQVSEIELDDGSRVSLDSDSTVRILHKVDQQTVSVLRGRVFFEVSHQKRAFKVNFREGEILVLGTKFLVERAHARTTTSVVEGRVQLKLRGGPSRGGAMLLPGNEGIATAGTIRVVGEGVDRIRKRLLWREGRVAFDDTPVALAVAEFNRYNQRKLVVNSVDAARTKIGGTFQLNNVDGFARIMKDAYGVNVSVLEEPGRSE